MPTIKLYEPLLASKAFSLSPHGVSQALSEAVCDTQILTLSRREALDLGRMLWRERWEEGEVCKFETLQWMRMQLGEME